MLRSFSFHFTILRQILFDSKRLGAIRRKIKFYLTLLALYYFALGQVGLDNFFFTLTNDVNILNLYFIVTQVVFV